jgi:hypothetical protein
LKAWEETVFTRLVNLSDELQVKSGVWREFLHFRQSVPYPLKLFIFFPTGLAALKVSADLFPFSGLQFSILVG